jgi:hypothetical protein
VITILILVKPEQMTYTDRAAAFHSLDWSVCADASSHQRHPAAADGSPKPFWQLAGGLGNPE